MYMCIYIYIYTDKTSLKADREVGGWGGGRDEPHRWVRRRGTKPTCGRSRVLPLKPASKKLY